MDLNNINFDDIKEKLLNIEKKTLIKYGSVVGAVILFLIIYYAILNPIVINKRNQLNDIFLNKKGKVTKKKPKKVSKKNVSYFTIPVKFEIKGNFLGYIRFKRQLSKSNKMLNFEKELIKLEKTGSSGIVVTGELSIVGLTNEFL